MMTASQILASMVEYAWTAFLIIIISPCISPHILEYIDCETAVTYGTCHFFLFENSSRCIDGNIVIINTNVYVYYNTLA